MPIENEELSTNLLIILNNILNISIIKYYLDNQNIQLKYKELLNLLMELLNKNSIETKILNYKTIYKIIKNNSKKRNIL